MYTYDTVTEALQGLKDRGYTIDFNVTAEQLVCSNNIHCLDIEDFEITEMHRFEGNTDPSDEDVVYAVESKDGKVKGVVSSAFGSYADNTSSAIIKKLTIHH